MPTAYAKKITKADGCLEMKKCQAIFRQFYYQEDWIEKKLTNSSDPPPH